MNVVKNKYIYLIKIDYQMINIKYINNINRKWKNYLINKKKN